MAKTVLVVNMTNDEVDYLVYMLREVGPEAADLAKAVYDGVEPFKDIHPIRLTMPQAVAIMNGVRKDDPALAKKIKGVIREATN